MQIVIDIDDEDYKRIQNISDVFSSLTSRTYSVIRNGTPLPKGHGRLIDADEVKSRMGNLDGFGMIGRCIDEFPTIVEADTTEGEKV